MRCLNPKPHELLLSHQMLPYRTLQAEGARRSDEGTGGK